MGGFVFTKTRLYELLTNVLYIGKVRYKKEIHQGEHQGIVDEEVFQLVQECLKRNGRSGGTALLRNKYGALLRGLLKCASCSAAMTQAARRKGGIVYRYYVCSAAQRLGRDTCPNPSVPAGELEQFVIDEIRGIGGDTNVLKEVIRLYRIETDEKIARLCKENDELRRDIARMARDADDLAVLAAANGGELASSLALNERLVTARRRQTDINDQLAALNKLKLDDSDARLMLADFDTIWANLTNREQCRLIELLVERVVYDGKKGVISITFRPSGITTLDANATELKGNAA